MPGATVEFSAPLPWKRVLQLAASVDFKPHEDDFQRFVEKRSHRSAQSKFWRWTKERYRSTVFLGLPPSFPFALEAACFPLLRERPPI